MTTTSPTQASAPQAAGARTFDAQRAALAGVVAIPVTPFAEDGSVDPDTYRALLRRLLDGGITTLTPNGNTGEFYALTPPSGGSSPS